MHDARQAFRDAIYAALGPGSILPDNIVPGELHRFPTNGKASDKAGWLKVFADGGGGVFGCHRQRIGPESWSAKARHSMTAAERATHARQVAAAAAERRALQVHEWRQAAERVAALWAECHPLVPGDPVTLYLKDRGFGGIWPLPRSLRLHPALRYRHDDGRITQHPAMVAPLVSPEGRTLSLHRTWLTRDGRKADVHTVRKLTPAAGPLRGSCIPLFPPCAGTLGIAEGIETALAAWRITGLPVVAAYSASNLATFEWPQRVQRLIVFADHDAAGQRAAVELRARALAAHVRCDVQAPTDPGADWCDVWAQGGEVAA